MKLGMVFSKVSDLFKYLRAGKKRKLYQQWVEMAELPPENIPWEEVRSGTVREEKGRDETQSRLVTLYIMQGATLVLLCAILILLIIQSC